jgi:hypothetical protein
VVLASCCRGQCTRPGTIDTMDKFLIVLLNLIYTSSYIIFLNSVRTSWTKAKSSGNHSPISQYKYIGNSEFHTAKLTKCMEIIN